jgi:hypothetical protein
MPESQFDWTKPSYKSLCRWKWFYASLVMVSLQNSKRKTDYLSVLLTPLRIRWTIPLRSSSCSEWLETMSVVTFCEEVFCHLLRSSNFLWIYSIYINTVPEVVLWAYSRGSWCKSSNFEGEKILNYSNFGNPQSFRAVHVLYNGTYMYSILYSASKTAKHTLYGEMNVFPGVS